MTSTKRWESRPARVFDEAAMSARISRALNMPLPVRAERRWRYDTDDDGNKLETGDWHIEMSVRTDAPRLEYGTARLESDFDKDPVDAERSMLWILVLAITDDRLDE